MESIKVLVFKRDGRSYFEAQWKDPVTGLKKTRSTGKDRRRDAERVAGQWEKELNEGTFYGKRQRVEWATFRERYESEVAAGLAPKTRQKLGTVFNAVERIINPRVLAALDARQLSRLVEGWRAEKLAESSIKGNLAHLQSALNWAHRQGMLHAPPRVEMPTRTAGMKGRPITGEEFERMLNSVTRALAVKQSSRAGNVCSLLPDRETVESWRHLLRGLWLSGLRIGEAMRLHWTEDRELCVDFSGRRPMFRIKADAHKSGKDCTLPMAPEFAQWLAETPEDQRTGFVFNPQPRRGTGRLRADSTSDIIVAIGKAANVKVAENARRRVKYASAHDLRRAFGFRWAMRVMPPILQQLMRHESINTTMAFYVGRNAEATADVLWNAVANTFANTGSGLVAGDSENTAIPVGGEGLEPPTFGM